MQTDVNEIVRTVLNVGTRVALQLIGAFVMWFVGRRLIDLAMRLVSRAMAHQNIDTTLVGYVTSSLSVLLNVVLVVAILGFFGVETTSFAAVLAAGGVAIGVAWSGMVCYILQSAVDWPDIHTSIITCMIVGLASEGAMIQKATLRISGAVVGAAMGFLAILFLIPHMESITSLTLLVAAGTAVAAWVVVGSPRISYAGVQIALAFYMSAGVVALHVGIKC